MSNVFVPPGEIATAPVVVAPETPWQRFRREFVANKLAMIGLALLLLAIGVAVFAP
jgi:peptide/nickel transport system permease protein